MLPFQSSLTTHRMGTPCIMGTPRYSDNQVDAERVRCKCTAVEVWTLVWNGRFSGLNVSTFIWMSEWACQRTSRPIGPSCSCHALAPTSEQRDCVPLDFLWFLVWGLLFVIPQWGVLTQCSWLSGFSFLLFCTSTASWSCWWVVCWNARTVIIVHMVMLVCSVLECTHCHHSAHGQAGVFCVGMHALSS